METPMGTGRKKSGASAINEANVSASTAFGSFGISS